MSEIEVMNEYRRELRDKILKTAALVFAERGIRGVKMDDIAHSLSISKRTLYELYSNKEVLLLESLKWSIEEHHEQMQRIAEKQTNVMDILIKFLKKRFEEFSILNPVFVNDLMKYPRIVKYFEDNNQARKEKTFRFLKRGIDEGYFKPEYNYELVIGIFEGIEKRIANQKLILQYSMKELFCNMILPILRGICTDKGIKMLDQFIEKDFTDEKTDAIIGVGSVK